MPDNKKISTISRTKLCQVCNKPFIFYRSSNKYCSDKCRDSKYKTKYTYKKKKSFDKTCEQCMSIFTTNDAKRKYCSRSCYEKHFQYVYEKKKPKELVCPICNNKFETAHQHKKYCSMNCYNEARRKRHGS